MIKSYTITELKKKDIQFNTGKTLTAFDII